MSKKKLIVLLIVLFTLSSAFGLQLKDAVELGIKNSAEVRIAANTLQKAVNSSKVLLNIPSFSLGASAGENVNLLEKTYSPSYSISGGISWTVGTSTLGRKNLKNLTLESANIAYQSSVFSVRDYITECYFEIVNLSNKVKIAQTSLDSVTKNYEQTLELYNASKASALALSQSGVSVDSAKIALEQAQFNLSFAKKNFAFLLGSQDTNVEDVVCPTSISADILKRVANEYLPKTTTFRAAKNKVSLAEENLRLGKKDTVFPSVTGKINLNGSYDGAVKANLSGTVSVNVPLNSYIPNTKDNVSLKNLNVDLDNAKYTYEKVSKDVSDLADNLIEGIVQTARTLGNLSDFADNAKKNYDFIKDAYEDGFASSEALSSALNTYTNALNSLENSRVSLITKLCSFASLVELDFDFLLGYLV